MNSNLYKNPKTKFSNDKIATTDKKMGFIRLTAKVGN